MPNLKTKILVVYYYFYPNLSGVGEVIYSYCSKYLEMYPECEIHLLCQNTIDSTTDSYLAQYDEINKIQIIRYQSSALLGGRVPLPSRDFITKLNTELDVFKPDQVHLHTRFATGTLFALLICKFKGQKNLIHYEHLSNYILGEKKSTEIICWIWDNTISRLMFLLSDKVVCVSNSVKKFITANIGVDQNKCIVIENGCNFLPKPISIADQISQRNQVSGKRSWNLFFGARFVTLKNPMIILGAINILAQKRNDFHFNIAGNGELETQMREFVKANNLDSFVNFLGKLNREQMDVEFEKSDIFINTSALEGFPGGVLEAIFCNNLCLVSNVGGNNDIITVPELLIDIKDLNPTNLAIKLENIMNNELLIAQKSQVDKDRVVSKNTWSNVVQELVKIV